MDSGVPDFKIQGDKMRTRKKKVDWCSIEYATGSAKRRSDDVLEMSKNFKEDKDKKARIENCLCKNCFYINNARIGGAAMTDRECGICSLLMHFASTCTDDLCLTCSKRNGLCRRCGGDIDMKIRRKKYPFMKD